MNTLACQQLLTLNQIEAWHWQLDTHTISGHPSLFKLFDLPPADSYPMEKLAEKVLPQDQPLIYQMLTQAQQGDSQVEATFRIPHHTDRILHLSAIAQVERDSNHTPIALHGSVQNISQFHKAELLPEFQRHHDPLTDLLNREGFLHATQSFLQLTTVPYAALVVLDIDRFQQINDTLGLHQGDGLLVMLAQRLRKMVRENDLVARLSADEFAILIKQVKSAEELSHLIRRYWQALQAPFTLNKQSLQLKFSLGIAHYPEDGQTVNQLLQAANAARISTKKQGGSGYQFYQPQLNATAHQELELEIALQQALQKNQIQLMFQPQVHAQDETLYGVEALIRWQHPELGAISPERFIPLAETSGLILQLGQFIIKQAIAQAVAWKNQGTPLHIGINLSPRQFTDPHLIQHIQQQPHFAEVAPLLDFEITETTAMQDVEKSQRLLQQLKSLNLSLAIDDFGTGYSSLSYLQTFPIDALKIDQAFVKNLQTETGKMLCKAIIQLGKNLNLKIIAEGIETTDQADFLRKQGADILQGYRYGKAMSAQEIQQRF